MTVGERFGPYRLDELIGRGGMSEVYRAYDTRRDRTVALKILPTALATNPRFEGRFRREARLVSRLSAPHIVPIHDFGEIDGRLFLDMRLVHGVDLATVLATGPLSPARAVGTISQVAQALDAAHADGLIHRDVKPSNVLYTGDPRELPTGHDKPDFVYLVDFGIALNLDAAEGPGLTATGHAVGTLGYMAPERFTGEPADGRVDVYALACTLYEALVGRPAFPGEGLAPLMFAHLHRLPPPVSRVDPTLPAALDAVLATALAKNPAERYRTAGEFAAAARAVLRGEPPRPRLSPTRMELTDPDAADRTEHRPDSAETVPHPVRRRTRARRIGAAAAAALVLAGAVLGVRELQSAWAPGPASLADCTTDPLSCNSVAPGQLADGGQLTMAVDADVASWNVATPQGSIGPTRWAMSSVLPAAFTIAPDFRATLNADLLTGAEQRDPRTVVYTIRPNARWSDGTPISVEDFRYNWRVRNGRDCPDCNTDQVGYDRIASITGAPTADGGSAVTVTFSAPFPDWTTLFASTSPLYPAHLAAQRGDLSTPVGLKSAFDWFGATVPSYSGGPLSVRSWAPGQALVLDRNPAWYGRAARLDRVVLAVMTDPAKQADALRAGQVQVIAPFDRADVAGRLTGSPGVATFDGAGMSWERLDVNLRSPALQRVALRQALFTAVDLGRVTAAARLTFGHAEPMTSHNFVPGQPGHRDVLAGTGQGSGDVEAARRILAGAGYTGVGSALVGPDRRPVPALRVVFPTGDATRQQVAGQLAEVGRQLGMTITPTPTDSLAGVLGTFDFDFLVTGWVIPPAQVVEAQRNWTSGAVGNYLGYSNPQVDRLITTAAGNPDPAAARDQLNQADQVMTADAVVLPLFRRPTLLAIRQDVANVRDNPMAGPLYNVADWGLRG